MRNDHQDKLNYLPQTLSGLRSEWADLSERGVSLPRECWRSMKCGPTCPLRNWGDFEEATAHLFFLGWNRRMIDRLGLHRLMVEGRWNGSYRRPRRNAVQRQCPGTMEGPHFGLPLSRAFSSFPENEEHPTQTECAVASPWPPCSGFVVWRCPPRVSWVKVEPPLHGMKVETWSDYSF